MHHRAILLLGVVAVGAAIAAPAPASALTMKECSTKFQAARKAGTLKGQKWNDFRKAECADDDAPETEASAAVKDEPTPAAKATPAARPGRVVFPRSVATQYVNETAGKARLKTCADQYNANKPKGANGELRWIQSGGGYWSECNKKLKG